MNCLKKEQLNNFLAGEGTEKERNEIENHLADCSDCRLQMISFSKSESEEIFPASKSLKEKAKRLPKKEKARATSSFFSFLFTRQTAFALASFVVLFSLVGFWYWNSEIDNDNTDVLRQGENNSNIPIILSPKNNANLSGEEITFSWKKLANISSYVLIISDEKGDIVFEKQTNDESLNVKVSESGLVSEKQYFWYVRAKYGNGKITETSPQKFTFKK